MNRPTAVSTTLAVSAALLLSAVVLPNAAHAEPHPVTTVESAVTSAEPVLTPSRDTHVTIDVTFHLDPDQTVSQVDWISLRNNATGQSWAASLYVPVYEDAPGEVRRATLLVRRNTPLGKYDVRSELPVVEQGGLPRGPVHGCRGVHGVVGPCPGAEHRDHPCRRRGEGEHQRLPRAGARKVRAHRQGDVEALQVGPHQVRRLRRPDRALLLPAQGQEGLGLDGQHEDQGRRDLRQEVHGQEGRQLRTRPTAGRGPTPARPPRPTTSTSPDPRFPTLALLPVGCRHARTATPHASCRHPPGQDRRRGRRRVG